MTIKALTTDGQWWTLAHELTKDEKTFEKLWADTNPGDLIETAEKGVFINKGHIIAILWP